MYNQSLKQLEDKMIKDYHTRHCCIFHGCKYGDFDCTVTTLKAKQECNCEDCEDYYDLEKPAYHHEVDLRSIILINEGKQNFILLKENVDIILGQLIILNLTSSDNVEESVKNYMKEYVINKVYYKHMLEKYNNVQKNIKSLVSSVVQIENYKVIGLCFLN